MNYGLYFERYLLITFIKYHTDLKYRLFTPHNYWHTIWFYSISHKNLFINFKWNTLNCSKIGILCKIIFICTKYIQLFVSKTLLWVISLDPKYNYANYAKDNSINSHMYYIENINLMNILNRKAVLFTYIQILRKSRQGVSTSYPLCQY